MQIKNGKFLGLEIQGYGTSTEHARVLIQDKSGKVKAFCTQEIKRAVDKCLELRQDGYHFRQGFWQKRHTL